MTPFVPLNLNNNTAETKFWQDPFVRLGPFSKIVNVESQGGLILNDGATFNRCRIGQYTSLGCYSYVADTEMGRYCTFASRISVGAFSHPTDWLSIHEFQYRDTRNIYGDTIVEDGVNMLKTSEQPTRIGCDVWIGDNATVGRGVSIGHGAIIGMSAVVVRDVEPYSIVVGNPAREVRKRFNNDTIAELLDLQWWSLSISEMKGVDFRDIPRAIGELRRRIKA